MSPIEADREQMIATLTPLCADVGRDILQDFVSRMDGEYFRRFTASTMAQHIRMAATLTPDHPCEVMIAEQPGRHVEADARGIRLLFRICHHLRPALRIQPQY